MTKKRRMAVVAVLLGNTMVMTETKAEEGGGNGWHTSSGISDSESRRTRR